jgi:MFS family permease
VPRRIKDRNIWLINLTILSVGLAYGMVLAIMSVFLEEQRDYDATKITSLAVWFALGLVTMSLPTGRLIRRFSARTALITALFGYSVTVVLFPWASQYFWLAAIDRFFDGAFSVMVWVSCETIILSRADNKHKAFVTSVFATAIAASYLLGPLTSFFGVVPLWGMQGAFYAASVVAVSTGLLVVFKLDPDLEPSDSARAEAQDVTGYLPIMWRIKTSLFGTFAYGYFQAAVVLLLPLFLKNDKGVPRDLVFLIPGYFALGMLLFANVMGRIGDRYGHLVTMRALGAVGGLTTCGFVLFDQYWAMCVAVACAGATLGAISPVSLALQGVVTERRDYSRANSIYNGIYAAGILLGPAVSGPIFDKLGGAVMLYHLAVLWAAFVLFTILFARDDPAARKSAVLAS